MKPTPEQKTQFAAEDWELVDKYLNSRKDKHLEQLCRHLTAPLTRFLRRQCRLHRDRIDETLQDVFLWLFENIDHLDRSVPLYTQLQRAASRSIRLNSISPPDRASKIVLFTTAFMEEDGYSQGETVSRFLESRGNLKPIELATASSYEEWKTHVVRRNVAKLPEKQRNAIRVRFEFNDITKEESAKELGIRFKTFDMHFRFGLAQLKLNNELRALVGLPAVEPPPPPTPKHLLMANKDSLTDRQVAVVKLIHEEKLSQQEAARRLGTYQTNVRYNWFAALKKIARSKELQTLTGIGPGMYGI